MYYNYLYIQACVSNCTGKITFKGPTHAGQENPACVCTHGYRAACACTLKDGARMRV